MKLNELFNTKTDLDVITNTDNEFVTRCKIGDDTYEFNTGRMVHPSERWDIEFSLIEVDDDGYEQRSYSLTDKREEFKVLSFVKQSMSMFIDEHHPEKIYFTANKQPDKFRTRADAYERIFSKFKGYDIERVPGDKTDKFKMIRKNHE